MTAAGRDNPSVPLTWGERDSFERLTAEQPRCRYCRKRATGVCGCCCPEHDDPPPLPVSAPELGVGLGIGLAAVAAVIALVAVVGAFWNRHEVVSTPDGPAVIYIEDGHR